MNTIMTPSRDAMLMNALPPEEAPRKVTVDVLDKLLHDHMAFYVDWAAINPYSSDYVEGYKPTYPDIIKEATAAIAALRRIQR